MSMSRFADLVVAHQDLVFGVALRVSVRCEQRGGCCPGSARACISGAQALSAGANSRAAAAAVAGADRSQRGAQRDARPAAARRAGRRGGSARLTLRQGQCTLAERNDERRMWLRLLAQLPERYRLAVALQIHRRPFVPGAGRDARPAAGQCQIGRPSRNRAAARRVRRGTARHWAARRRQHHEQPGSGDRRYGDQRFRRPTDRGRLEPPAPACPAGVERQRSWSVSGWSMSTS